MSGAHSCVLRTAEHSSVVIVLKGIEEVKMHNNDSNSSNSNSNSKSKSKSNSSSSSSSNSNSNTKNNP